jgi:inorganic triphosphatase YgiF
MGDGPAADHIEVEWQFDAPDLDAVVRWLAETPRGGYVLTAGTTLHLHDTYYETADWRLRDAGYTCRVRQHNRHAELTLKSRDAAVDGIRSRRELNEPLPAGEPVPRTATGDCAALLDSLCPRDSLRPIFEIHTERRIFFVSDAMGRLAEVALDTSTVPANPTAVLRRVEVEATSGDVTALRPFVEQFAAANHLVPATTSKVGFALAAIGLASPSQ